MKNFIKKITGIEKLEKEKAKKEQELLIAANQLAEAEKATEKAKRQEELAKMTPKERATAREEPYVAVLDTHVNKENVRNGFFELDWNEYFIVQLRQAGYGYEGDKEEEIVDRWFRDLARNVLAEEGQDVSRGAGYINVNKLADGKAEVK
jgi:hypothetical protein